MIGDILKIRGSSGTAVQEAWKESDKENYA